MVITQVGKGGSEASLDKIGFVGTLVGGGGFAGGEGHDDSRDDDRKKGGKR